MARRLLLLTWVVFSTSHGLFAQEAIPSGPQFTPLPSAQPSGVLPSYTPAPAPGVNAPPTAPFAPTDAAAVPTGIPASVYPPAATPGAAMPGTVIPFHPDVHADSGPGTPPVGVPPNPSPPTSPGLGPLPPPSGTLTPAASNLLAAPLDTKPAKIEPPPKIWEGSLELGVNGTDGNSHTFNLHTGGKVKRKTDDDIFSAEFGFHQDNNGSQETADKGTFESRYERTILKSPWTWFVKDNLDYDQFKPYEFNLGMHTGVGYQFLKNDTTTFTGRIGGGTSHEFDTQGDSDQGWPPELLFGIELEHKISARHKVAISAEYTPDVADFTNNYRLRGKASWEILLDEATHLSLKFSVADKYDSTPGPGGYPNDMDYAALLMWSF